MSSLSRLYTIDLAKNNEWIAFGGLSPVMRQVLKQYKASVQTRQGDNLWVAKSRKTPFFLSGVYRLNPDFVLPPEKTTEPLHCPHCKVALEITITGEE